MMLDTMTFDHPELCRFDQTLKQTLLLRITCALPENNADLVEPNAFLLMQSPSSAPSSSRPTGNTLTG